MSFDNNFLGQLVNKLPTLEEELVQILTATKKPLSVSDIYKQSKVAVTSRDISLLLAQRREALNIEIAHFATRPGFRECAHYQMSTINDQVNDIQLSLVTDTPELKHEEVSEMNAEVKPKALQILEYIEANALCTMRELQAEFNDKMLGESYIKGYINDGRVLISKNSVGKKEFRIAPGIKVTEFYGIKVINKTPKVQAETIREVFKPAPVLPVLDIDAVYKNTPLVNDVLSKPKFKIAITNERTLILFGIHNEPIELDAQDSDALIDFCEQIAMSISVPGTDTFSIAGKQL